MTARTLGDILTKVRIEEPAGAGAVASFDRRLSPYRQPN